MASDPIKFNPNADNSKEQSSCNTLEPYALQVLGVDMEPEFPENCIIIIEPSHKPVDGAYMVVNVDGETWFRQFKANDSKPYLVTANPLYPDIALTNTEWSVLGIIRQRNLKRDIKHYSYDE